MHLRRTVTAIVVASLAAASLPARSAKADTKLVVLPFQGKGSRRLTTAVRRALGKHRATQVVPYTRARKAARRLQADLTTPAGRQEVAAELELGAWIRGKTTRKKRRYTLRVSVHDASDGRRVKQVRFRGKSLKRLANQVKARLWRRLRRAISETTVPVNDDESELEPDPLERPEEEQEQAEPTLELTLENPDARAEEAKAERQAETSTTPFGSALEATLELQGVGRRLSYKQDLYGNLRPYSLPLWPALMTQLRVYPLALATNATGVWSDLGLEANFARTVQAQSQYRSAKYDTVGSRLYAGARLRLHLGRHRILLTAGYGKQSFELIRGQEQESGIPGVDYRYLRAGLGTRFVWSQGLMLEARAGYLLLLDAGQITSAAWFPKGSVGGLDGEALLYTRLTSSLSLISGLELRRYYYSMNPSVADVGVQPRIAGGAVDQYLLLRLGVAFHTLD